MYLAQSYGGFMAAKVVEADAGIHGLAMSVAVRVILGSMHSILLIFVPNQPVISWRLYGVYVNFPSNMRAD